MSNNNDIEELQAENNNNNTNNGNNLSNNSNNENTEIELQQRVAENENNNQGNQKNSSTTTTDSEETTTSDSKMPLYQRHSHQQHQSQLSSQAQTQQQQQQPTPSCQLSPQEKLKLNTFSLFTPQFVLFCFTSINFFIYFERGQVAPALPFIRVDRAMTKENQNHEPLSQTQLGFLFSAFMIGFILFQPLFVAAGGYVSSKNIIAAGIAVWILAMLFASTAQSYSMLLFARALTGIGESAIVPWSVTILDNCAPASQKALYLGLFYSMIPAATATGIGVNGFIAGKTYFEGNENYPAGVPGWRLMFGFLAIPMLLIFIIVAVLLPREYNVRKEDRPIGASILTSSTSSSASSSPPRNLVVSTENNEQQQETSPQQEHNENIENNNNNNNAVIFSTSPSHVPLSTAATLVLTNKKFLLATSGAAMITFSLGAISFYAVTMLVQSDFGVSVEQASLLLGLSIALCGLVASIVGGLILDNVMPGGGVGAVGSLNSCKIMMFSTFLAFPFGLAALYSGSFTMFCVLIIPAVFFSFLYVSPMTIVLLGINFGRPELRPYTISFNSLIIHVGDLFSAPICGLLADYFDGGCNKFYNNKLLCLAHSPSNGKDDKSCKFIEARHQGEQSSCIYAMELFESMRIVWLFLLLALPLWWQLTKEFKKLVEANKQKEDSHL